MGAGSPNNKRPERWLWTCVAEPRLERHAGGETVPALAHSQRRQIKGAARGPVRPKSREETPKEGSEVSDRVTNSAARI
jgi:hypothetical protein